MNNRIIYRIKRFISHYRFLEFSTSGKGLLPKPPTEQEKYDYTRRHINILLPFSVISYSGTTISLILFIKNNTDAWPLDFFVGLNFIYFLVSMIVNTGTKAFNTNVHDSLVRNWHPKQYPSVDIFLPNAGEDIRILQNTWIAVTRLAKTYPGIIQVYCLDDSDLPEVKELATRFHFKYIVRPDRGYFKKAGNLRHGYRISHGDFIVIFDADFVPRTDFLQETLPYFENSKVGIVQTPQYFSVSLEQNWLERGAGAVQELFYRFSQVSREDNDASICVGSNAVYRRIALDSTGGTALIEHSEDVHTGFNLRKNGWQLKYIPIVLAKGLCPSTMPAFFSQQYRWCMGSMSLLGSRKFWHTKMRLRTRLSYVSGFLYYIQTAIMSFYAPVLPLIILIALPLKLSVINYTLILPAFIFTQIIYPAWHKSIYGTEAWAVRSIYGWAHFFAIFDCLTRNRMGWQPTGSKIKSSRRYVVFRTLQVLFNYVPAVGWTTLAAYYFIRFSHTTYLPILLSGLYYLLITSKVTFYSSNQNDLVPPKIKIKDAANRNRNQLYINDIIPTSIRE